MTVIYRNNTFEVNAVLGGSLEFRFGNEYGFELDDLRDLFGFLLSNGYLEAERKREKVTAALLASGKG